MGDGAVSFDVHELRLLPDMGTFLESVAADFQRASRRAWVETYIVKADRLGHRLAGWLGDAAARGADARLLYDPSGSHEAPSRFFEELRSAGVKVRPYGRGAWLGRLRPGVRDHARIVQADDISYTGGHAFAREWLPADEGGGGWHDVACRIRGPVCDDFVSLFEARWREAQDRDAPRDFDTGDRHPDVRLISEGPRGSTRVMDSLCRAFDEARRRIWVENAYCYPPMPILRSLARAAGRGVDVRLLVPGVTDLPIVTRAARAEYGTWRRAGIAIHEYEPTVLHSKYAVVDGDWCAIGSYNVIATAGRAALETVVVSRQERFVTALAQQFEADLTRCRRISDDYVRTRSWWDREVDLMAQLLLATTDALLGRRGRLAALAPHPLRAARV